MKRLIAAIVIAFSSSGCSTELTQSGSQVRIIQQSEVRNCLQVQHISVSLPLGGAQDAQRAALNETAAAGADSLYIYFTWADALRGAQVQGDALRCKFG